MTYGGRKRSTFPAVQLISSPRSCAFSTTSLPGKVWSAAAIGEALTAPVVAGDLIYLGNAGPDGGALIALGAGPGPATPAASPAAATPAAGATPSSA